MFSNNKNAKNAKLYSCKLCDYNTSRKSNYTDHILSAKHQKSIIVNNNLQIINEKQQIISICQPTIDIVLQNFTPNVHINNKNQQIISNIPEIISNIPEIISNNPEIISNIPEIISNNFYCELCKYKTNRKSSYENHLLTKKHKNSNICNNNTQPKHQCEICNKKYKEYSGLWRHKKKCVIPKVVKELQEEILKLDYTNDIVGKLIQENQSLRNFVIEQNQEIMKLMVTQNNTIAEFSKSTTTNNTVNNNNNKFNINLFLNEKCKDAMNFADFIKNIEVSHEDLENNAQLGFANGISKIIMDNLKQLSICDRPIHCSDVKRETMYIKDDDKWEKEEDTKKLTNAIQNVSQKSVASLMEWQETNPEFEDMDSDFSNKFLTMMQQSMAGNKRDALYPKVIRTLAKETMIEKM